MNHGTRWLNAIYEYSQSRVDDKTHILDQITYSDKEPERRVKLCFVGQYTCAFCFGNVYPMDHWGIKTDRDKWLWCEQCHSITRLCCRMPMGLTFYDQDGYPAGVKNPILMTEFYDNRIDEMMERSYSHPIIARIIPLRIGGPKKKKIVEKRGFPIVPFHLLERFVNATDIVFELYCTCTGQCIGTCCNTGIAKLDRGFRYVADNLIYDPDLTSMGFPGIQKPPSL